MLAFVPCVAFAENSVTTASTPAGIAQASWTFDYKAYIKSEWPSASEPVITGNYVYIAVDNQLLKIDSSTGSVVASATLAGTIGYTTRATYSNGLIIVPQNAGIVQAFSADTMALAWSTDAIRESAQNSSTMAVDNGKLFFLIGDVDYSAGTYTNATLTCLNVATGEVLWQNTDAADCYYWSGGALAGNFFVVSTSKGTLKVFDKEAGELLDSYSLGANVNSDCIYVSALNKVVVMSRDGMMNVLTLDETGKITAIEIVDIGLSGCACAPTVSGSTIYVGGEVNAGGGSALAIVDASTYETLLVETADGSALASGGIKGAPLVSTNSAGTFVYFTVNNAVTADWVTYTSGGGVYSYKLGNDEAKLIYDAAGHNQYCDSPVVCDASGSLYYINDSSTLFKLVAKTGGGSGDQGSGDQKTDGDSSDDKKDDDSSDTDKTDDDSKGDKKDDTEKDNHNKHKSDATDDRKDKNSLKHTGHDSSKQGDSKDSDKDSKDSSDSKKSKSEKEDKNSSKKNEDSTKLLENATEDKPTAIGDSASSSDSEDVDYLPFAGLVLGASIAFAGFCYLMASKEGAKIN